MFGSCPDPPRRPSGDRPGQRSYKRHSELMPVGRDDRSAVTKRASPSFWRTLTVRTRCRGRAGADRRAWIWANPIPRCGACAPGSDDRVVANAIARSAPAREQKRSCRARSADGPDWANPVVRLWRRRRAWRSRSRRPRGAGLPEKRRSPDGVTGPVRACYEVGPTGFGLYRGGGDRLSAGSAIICATRSTFAIRRVRTRGSSGGAWKHEQRGVRCAVEDLDVNGLQRGGGGEIVPGAGVARVARVGARGDLQADAMVG